MTILETITRYAEECIADPVHNGQKHRWACERLLRDIGRIGSEGFPYIWDEARAQSIVTWFTLLRHSKGVLAGQPIHLTDWQKFRICQIYGWVHKDTGKRRFKRSFAEVARKNAKSQEEAGIALYEISVTATKNGEVAEAYTAGTKKDQSKIVFKEAKLALRKSPLQLKFKCKVDSIEHILTGSTIKPLSKDDGKNGDGTNPALMVLDEYHQHKTTEYYDLSYGSQTKEPLLVIITTAGVDLNCPCFTQEYSYCTAILDPGNDAENDEYLIDICEMDPEDYKDPANISEDAMQKANPIRMSYPEGREKILADYKIAKEVPAKMTAWLTKEADVWVMAQENGYMDMARWKACEVKELPVDISGMPVYVGFDMSAKIDMTSVSFVIPFRECPEDGPPVVKYIVFHHSFIPSREKLIERMRVDKMPYDAWERLGYITVTNTQVVDQDAVKSYFLNWIKDHGVTEECLCFDPANAGKLMLELSEDGHIVEEVFQSHKHLNEATQGFREQVYLGNVIYLPDPVLNYAMGNAVIRQRDGLIKIDKDATTKRVDPVDSTLCAFKLALYHDWGAADFGQDIEAFLEMDL